MMLNVDELRAASTRHALTFGGVVIGMGFLFALAFALVGAFLEIPFSGYVAGAIFFAFGMVCVVIVIQQYNEITRHIHNVVAVALDMLEAETEHKYRLPPLPTYLPTEPETFKLTASGGAGGEAVQEVVKELVNGFDPRDLDWFAKYLASGNRYSEAALEKMPLPYEGVLLGGLTEGTPLTRLLNLCEEKKILSPRDGKSRKTGKLLIVEEKEIARRLKEKTVSE